MSASIPASYQAVSNLDAARLAALAPRPTSVQRTGISIELLADITSKHLLTTGVLALSALADRLALSGAITEEVLQFLRKEARIEVRARSGGDSELRFGLTERGRAAALDAMYRSGYVGPVPVPFDEYVRLVHQQTVHQRHVTRGSMRSAFDNVILSEMQRDRLGAALNSGRAIFIYGSPGTGKTYIAQRLRNAIPGQVLVPYAIQVGDSIIQLFDPTIHSRKDAGANVASIVLENSFDRRYVYCERPVVPTGGELTADMLEVSFNSETRQHFAPLQLKANNGLFIIDDLGRQRIATGELFNRWIVPMEERFDHLSTSHGTHFKVPFDVILIFATNLSPHELADEAFLRRIGYKIHFTPVAADEYRLIWKKCCEDVGIPYDAAAFGYVLHELHAKKGVPLFPCIPRDLIAMAKDNVAYNGEGTEIDEATFDWAWSNYFIDEPAGALGASRID